MTSRRSVAAGRSATDPPHKVLLVEDNPGDADLVCHLLGRSDGHIVVECADRLSGGIARLRAEEFDLVLLDLWLPDSVGLDTLSRIRASAPDLPVVVLTGLDDQQTGLAAVRSGAEDYLLKSELDRSVLSRSIRYAIERHRLRRALGAARQQKERERELRALERLSGSAEVTVSARAFGSVPLREAAPEQFDEWVHGYRRLLERSLEEQAYKVKPAVSESLRSLAEELGILRAGPRDVVDVHTAAMRATTAGAPRRQAGVYARQGHMLLVELMGHLVAHYRLHARRTPARGGRPTPQTHDDAATGTKQ